MKNKNGLDLENSDGFVIGQTHFRFMLLNQWSLHGIVSARADKKQNGGLTVYFMHQNTDTKSHADF